MTSQVFFGAEHPATMHPPHNHDHDQLLWFPDGAMQVLVGAQRWIVRNTAAFWLPAGIVHSIEPLSTGSTHSVYSSARVRPLGEHWDQPRAISCTPFMAEIIRHVTSGDLTAKTRSACRELLVDLMEHTQEQQPSLAIPTHPAARAVAEHLLQNPQDNTSLAEFAEAAGVSQRTIMRAFISETGHGVSQWRTQARLLSSLSLLAEGVAVQTVAELVGYRTTSGYIDAFRKMHGKTPAVYARTAQQER